MIRARCAAAQNDGSFGGCISHCFQTSTILIATKIIPTYIIQTDSRCKSNNRMGGALAIVTHCWKPFVTRWIPCPTGLGLVNVLDIAVGPYNIHSINPYFLSTSPGKGLTTIYTRVIDYIKKKTSPVWAKKLEPQMHLFAYAQWLASTAHLKNWFNITR
jgi:hypothetical protein